MNDMRAWRRVAVTAAAAIGVCTGGGCQRQPRTWTFTVREPLNQEYGAELLTFPFTAERGECQAAAVSLAGPDGPLAVQLSDTTYWPGGKRHVKTARLCFIAEAVKALTTTSYTATCGGQAGPPHVTDLRLARNPDSVEIFTRHMGVRVPLYDGVPAAPLAAADVPGPLLAMRMGDGNWAGGSSLKGDAAVTAWRSWIADAGPVFARVVTSYDFADGNRLEVVATVAAGDRAVRWEMSVRDDHPELALEFRLPPVPGVTEAVFPKGYGQWAREDRKVALTPGPEPFCFLSPDTSLANIFPDGPPYVHLAPQAGGTELQIRSRDPGAWSDPVAPLTYAGVKTWDLDSIPRMWEVWKRKRIPLVYAADGTVTLTPTLAKGRRKWQVSAGPACVGEELDRLKGLTFEWPADPERPHPRLFADAARIQAVRARAEGDAELAKWLAGGTGVGRALRLLAQPVEERKPEEVTAVVDELRSRLALRGRFDVMRGAIGTATLYDVLIDSGLLTPADRALFRAQMADLAYVMADPQCWDMERGYLSGNPNMSCSYTLSLGVLACALADHPAAPAWAERATRWLDKWLTDEVGAAGEWLCEGSHYGYVSLEPMLTYAITARRAGFHDFSQDPRLKKLILYFAKYNTPRDVQRKNLRSIGAYGRGHGGFLAVFGVAAAFYQDSDPELSRTLQWLWAENGHPLFMGDSRLGGMEPYFVDRRLPAAAPAWESELFPQLGALLRAGFNTPTESYVNLLTATDSLRNLDIWTPGIGGISQWFGRGRPLSTCFTWQVGYHERHELLRDGVRLARNWGATEDPKGPFGHYTGTRFGAFAALPCLDYVRSTFVNTRADDRDWFPENLPPYPRVTPATATDLEWTRQALFVKDADPAGPAYLVLRDTTAGGQPTAWQFWTLSDKLGTPDQARDAAFLADKPGPAHQPARELPPGNRYTAVGQFGMDVEYFIASPADTPRHTLRWGGTWAGNRVPEYQDLLHLQMPGDGAYVVVLFPRPRDEAPPSFASFGDGRLIKVSGAYGTDYCFLSSAESAIEAEGVSVRATAATVQERPDGVVLSLPAGGTVRHGAYGLASPVAASMQVTEEAVSVTLPRDTAGGRLTVFAPAGRRLLDAPTGVAAETGENRYDLTIPAGVTGVVLGR